MGATLTQMDLFPAWGWETAGHALLACLAAAFVRWLLFAITDDNPQAAGSSTTDAAAAAASRSRRQKTLDQQHMSAMDRIRRLPFEGLTRERSHSELRLRSFLPFSDRQKWSESVRKSRQQGDGLSKLHTPLTAATSSSANLVELEQNPPSLGAGGRKSSPEDSMTPHNLASSTLAHQESGDAKE